MSLLGLDNITKRFGGLVAVDDVSGQQLDPKLMMAARRDEIAYFRSMGVYEKVDMAECWKETGKAPIAVRWVDINKGDSSNPNYRSRLVAKEFNTGVCPELYAATPPSECLRLMLSMVASSETQDIGLVYNKPRLFNEKPYTGCFGSF